MARLVTEVDLEGTSRFRRKLDSMRDDARRWNIGIGGALAGAFAVGGIVAGLRTLTEEMDRIGKLSSANRINPEALQRLGFAAEQNGADMETMAKGLGNLQVSIAELEDGTSTYVDAFKDLNLGFEDFKSLDPEQAFMKLSDAFKGAEDRGRAFNAVMKILGARVGRELVNTLGQGGEGIRSLGEQVTVTSAQNVRAIEKFNDKMNQLKTTIMGIAGNFIGDLARNADVLFEKMGTRINQLVRSWQGMGEVLSELFSGNFEGLITRIQKIREQVGSDIMKDEAALHDRINEIRRNRPEEKPTGDAFLGRGAEEGASGARGARGGGGGGPLSERKGLQEFFDPNLSRGGNPGRSFVLNFDSKRADAGLETVAKTRFGNQLGGVLDSGFVSDKAVFQPVVKELEANKKAVSRLEKPLVEIERKIDQATEFEQTVMARFRGL